VRSVVAERRRSRSPLEAVGAALGSLRLSVAIVFLMAVVTFCGTLAQEHTALLDVQLRYFESWWILEPIGRIVLPLPGGLTLMIALAINLAVGGMLRLKRTWSRVGVLITHLGVAMLLLAGAVRYAFAEEGMVLLYEGESTTSFTSYHDWEIVVEEPDAEPARQWVVPYEQFDHASEGGTATFRHPELPFALEVSHWMRNSAPQRKGPMTTVEVPVVRGLFLRQLDPHPKNAESNLAGCYVTVRDGDRQLATEILWGGHEGRSLRPAPATVDVAGRRFGLLLRKKLTPLPFELRLEDFTVEFFPRTRKPRTYESRVSILDGDSVMTQRIRMNEPLRREGVVVYQSTWGPPNAAPGQPLYSGLQTVRNNHADAWPIWACAVIAIGMALHFGMKFHRFMTRSSGR